MGVVYRAHDDRLERDVALKLLPSGTLADDAARKRFRKEALALSKLNHPNIATVFDFDAQAGVDFLVMEYVAGATMGEKLGTGPMPEKEVARLGLQLAEGLAAAHGQGVIHRDLKPGNVRLAADGRLKILDFGLAKLVRPPRDTAPTESVTETQGMVGTLPYMAPEQVRGERVDERMDVYAAGAVLYEMASGKRAFPQAPAPQLLEAILHEIPPAPSTMNRGVSQALDGIILKALDKEPERRYQSARELAVDLERLITPGRGRVSSRAGLSARSRRRVAVGALIGLLAISGLVWGIRWLAGPRPELRHEFRQRQLTSDPLEKSMEDAAISPDGRYLAYTTRGGIQLMLIDTGETQALTLPSGFPAEVGDLAWFPDGTRLLAQVTESDGRPSIWAVAPVGGDAHRLRNDSQWPSVSPDGARIAFEVPRRLGIAQRGIWVMDASGGNPRRILTTGSEEYLLRPSWSPNGRRIAYERLRWKPQSQSRAISIESVGLDGHPPVVIASPDTWRGNFRLDFVWLPDGRVVFARPSTHRQGQGDNLWEIRTHPRTGTPIGEPRRLTDWAGFKIRDLSASADGKRLAFLKDIEQSDVYVGRLKYPGPRLETPRRLTLDDGHDLPASWTHDSKAVLFQSNRKGHLDIFHQGLDQSRAEAISMSSEIKRWPCLSPDGAWILYDAGLGGYPWSAQRLMRIPVAGGPPESVFVSSGEARYRCALPPAKRCVVGEVLGQKVVFSALDPVKGRGAELTRVEIELGGFGYSWDLSPDGRSIALFDQSNRLRIVDLDRGEVRQLSVPPVLEFLGIGWSSDGKGLMVTGEIVGGVAILFVGLDGRIHRMWERRGSSAIYGSPSASPDGRYLAFWSKDQESEAWMLEDF